MNLSKYYSICIFLVVIVSCKTKNEPDIEVLKSEVIAAEKAFNDMAKERGIKEAFVAFAAPNGVLIRGDKIIAYDSIAPYHDKSTLTDIELTWKPDFVDVSKSGDLAYTYGKYSFSAKDTAGNPIKSEGIFHTVWKRQPDGSWKYVYD